MDKEIPTTQSIVDKLMVALSDFSEQEVLSVTKLFSQPDTGKAFSEMLRQRLALKQLEAKTHKTTSEPKPKPVAPKATTSKTVTPKAAAPKTTTPKTVTPKAAVSKTAKPKTAEPKTTPKPAEPKAEISGARLDYAKKLNKDSFFEVLPDVLSDRQMFPFTRDAIDTMSKVCGLKANHETFRKSGRKRLIRHYTKQLENMSADRQGRLAKKLVDWLKTGKP